MLATLGFIVLQTGMDAPNVTCDVEVTPRVQVELVPVLSPDMEAVVPLSKLALHR